MTRALLTAAWLSLGLVAAHADGGAFPGGPPKGGQVGSAASFPPASGGGANIATTLGTANVFSSTGTAVITTTVAAPSGRLVVCTVHDNYEVATAGSVASSPANTWLLGAHAVSVGNADSQIFYSFLTSALSIGSTITYSTAPGFTGSQTFYTGCASYPGFTSVDSATSNNATNFSGAYSVTGAASGAVAGELNVGLVTGGNPLSNPAGWTTAPPDMPTNQEVAAYQINAGTSPLTFSGTLSAQWWAAAIVSFKP